MEGSDFVDTCLLSDTENESTTADVAHKDKKARVCVTEVCLPIRYFNDIFILLAN
jgi:hypothetical protein